MDAWTGPRPRAWEFGQSDGPVQSHLRRFDPRASSPPLPGGALDHVGCYARLRHQHTIRETSRKVEGRPMTDSDVPIRKRGAFLCLTLCLALVPIGLARAEVTRVVVKASGPMGAFEGREYLWVTARMEGTVDRGGGNRGHYRVPVVLMYPDRNPNGFGFVDVVNSADFIVYKEGEAPAGKRSMYYVGDIIFSDYLRREGFTYLAVQWARMVTYVLGAEYGVIEDGRDGYAIVKDAARFLRDPRALEGAVPFRPAAVGRVIGFGQSQTASLLLELVRTGQNRDKGGSLVFDGILAGV